MRRRLIVIGPLPPPYHGVTVSTELVLANQELDKRFSVIHVDTSDHRPNSNVGRWDITNLVFGLRDLSRLLRALRGASGVVYLPLSQSAPGFLRDSLFIHASALRRWKIAVHLRGSDFDSFYRTSPALMRRWIRYTLARVDSAAVMGTSLRWILKDLVPPERIAVVQNGTPEPSANGVERDSHTVLFLSNLRRRKGLVQALDAALIVLRDQPEARFLFVGEWEDEELERRMKERAAAADGRIEFLGPVVGAAKDSLLASSSVLLFPPIEPEGHPRVVIEALAAGLPIVATDRGAITETVTDGESGYVVPDPSPETLATHVLALLRDGALRERMGCAGRDTYVARFTQQQADSRLAEWLFGLSA